MTAPISRIALSLALLALSSSLASAAWVPIQITGFVVDKPKTYGPDCANPSTGTFDDTKAVGALGDAQLDAGHNCVSFTYKGLTIFVHATNVQHAPTGAVKSTACEDANLADTAGGGRRAGLGMGNAATVRPEDCRH